MISHEQYELISDLEQKLFLYKDKNFHNREKYLFNNEKAQIASKLLLSSTLNFKLDRENINIFLSGKLKAKLINGQEVSIKSSISIEALENKNLIYFIEDSLKLPYSYDDNSDTEIKKTMDDLASLVYGKNNFQCSELRISKNHLTDIKIKFKDVDFLEKIGDEYRFKFEYKSIKPVASELWKFLKELNLSNIDTFKKWLFIMNNTFDYSDIIDLEFENEICKKDFISESISYLLSLDELKLNYEDTYKKLLLESRRHNFSLYGNQNISIPIELKKLNPDKDFLDAYLWWNSNFTNELLFMNGYNTYGSLIYFITKNDSFNYNEDKSFANTKILLNKCLNRPFIAGEILSRFGNDYLIPFYLSQPKTLVVGMLHILSNNNLPNMQSNKNNYRKQWQELIWNQTLDIFFLFLEKNRNVEETGEIVLDLLIQLVEIYFEKKHVENFYLNNTFKTLEKIKIHKISNAPKENLLKQIFPILVNRIKDSNIGRNFNFLFPYEKIYLLFWLLEKGYKQSLEVNNDKNQNILNQNIVIEIIKLYQSAFDNNRLQENDSMNDFNWKLLLKLSSTEQKESLFNTLENINIDELENDNFYNVLHNVRVHFKFLLIFYNTLNKFEQEKIEAILLNILEKYGNSKNNKRDIFQPFLEKNENTIFSKFIQISNNFTKNGNERLLEYMFNNSTFSNLLELYKYQTSVKNKKLILEHLQNKQIDENDFSHIQEIIDSIASALNDESLIDFFEPLLDILKNNQRGKRFENIYLEIKYKNDLFKIFNQKVLSEENRIKKIKSIDNPFKDRANFGNSNQSMWSEADRFKRFLIGATYFDKKPDKTYDFMRAILQEHSHPLYASNMLNARLKVIENTYDKKEEDFFIAIDEALNEWEEWQKSFTNSELDKFDYLVLFEGYQIINNSEKFSFYWNKIPEYLKYNLDIALRRCKFLQKQNMSSKALDYLEKALEIHGEVDKLKESDFKNLRKDLIDNIEIEYSNKIMPIVNSNAEEIPLRDVKDYYWSRIKPMVDSYHAVIFSKEGDDNSLEGFILENMRLICSELLIRNFNLKDSINKLKIENLINDWVSSLINHRMSYLAWTSKDQSRIGISGEGKDSGEVDIIVSNQSGENIFLIEAFRLFYTDRTSIKKHMNKISGYNAEGCAIVFILVYCHNKNFFELSKNYENYLLSVQYNEFDDINLSLHKFDEIDSNKAKLKILKEIRKKNAKDITIFHMLCDFS